MKKPGISVFFLCMLIGGVFLGGRLISINDKPYNIQDVKLKEKYSRIVALGGGSNYFLATNKKEESTVLNTRGEKVIILKGQVTVFLSKVNKNGILPVFKNYFGTGILNIETGKMIPMNAGIIKCGDFNDSGLACGTIFPENVEAGHSDSIITDQGKVYFVSSDKNIIKVNNRKIIELQSRDSKGKYSFFSLNKNKKISGKSIEKINDKYNYIWLLEDSNQLITCSKKDNKYGLIDLSGKQIIPSKYDSLSTDCEKNGFVAEKNKKFGIIDKTNHIILPFNYQFLSSPNDNHLVVYQKKKEYGIMEDTGRIVYKAKKGEEISDITNENVFIVTDKENNFKKMVTLTKNKIIDFGKKKGGKKIKNIEISESSNAVTATKHNNKKMNKTIQKINQDKALTDAEETFFLKNVVANPGDVMYKLALSTYDSNYVKRMKKNGESISISGNQALEVILTGLDLRSLSKEEKILLYSYAAVYANNEMYFDEAKVYAKQAQELNPKDETIKKILDYTKENSELGVTRDDTAKNQKLP
ncbi:WG repeat-containing protein [Vagococcus entomophilus]|uniref:WG repeat-containing protein n=1 Tax=Vagococcus entomophilus TaxID=1160095 RepID=A0A430AGH8_9ENTE|nr:WG repeat-containing protein [Vagococcus entomophilus]RSU06947.1 hypothetical protein CBF30_06715 [Vagococcus entomophilus]